MAGAINYSTEERLASEPVSKRHLMLLTPALLLILAFLIIPLGVILIYSFLQPGTYGGVEWVFSPDAYVQFLFERDFLTDALQFHGDYLSIFFRSFVLATTATALCFLVGFPTAYFIATRPVQTRTIWLLAITVPYWVNLLIRTVAMLFIIRDQGPLNEAMLAIGLIDEPIRMAYTNYAIGLGLFYSYLPFMVLPIYASIERLEFSLVEAAHDLYASRWRTMRFVILPAIKPGVIAGSLLVFIPSLGAFIAPDILGGGKSLMIGNLIALQFQGSRNWPFGAAVAIILLSIVLILLLIAARRSRTGEAK